MEEALEFNIDKLDYDNLMSALHDYAEEARALYRRKLIEDDKFTTQDKLIKNIKTDVKAMGVTFTVVLYLEDYWKYVEGGRKPGKKWPPRDAIRRWIDIKPIIPEERNGKLPTPEQLTFLIQRKIGEEGIEPGNQLRDTVESINSYWLPKLQAALQKDFDTFTIKVFNAAAKMIKI